MFERDGLLRLEVVILGIWERKDCKRSELGSDVSLPWMVFFLSATRARGTPKAFKGHGNEGYDGSLKFLGRTPNKRLLYKRQPIEP